MLLLCCILSMLCLALAIKLILLKQGLRETGRELTLILSRDTNRLIGLPSRDGDLRRLAAVLNDQLKILQQERHLYQDGDRTLKETVSNISHDLRTPLTAISGYLELLSEEPQSKQALRYLDIVRNRVDAMKLLAEELFRYSVSLTTIKEHPERLSLNRVLEDSLLSYYELLCQKGITPTISLPDIHVMRFLDKSALSRIMGNIIGNALKYSQDDLHITLKSDGTVTFVNSAPNLTPVKTARLFDRYYTVDNLEESTGLGLSIAKQLTEHLGGQITAKYRTGSLEITVVFPETQGEREA